MAISARRTYQLRLSGLHEILELTRHTPRKMQDPSIYGDDEHYNRIVCWGAQRRVDNGGLGITIPRAATLADLIPHNSSVVGDQQSIVDGISDHTISKSATVHKFMKLSQSLIVTKMVNRSIAQKGPTHIPPLDFSKYTYPKRTEDKDCWPRPNPKSICSRKNLVTMMMSRHAIDALALHGVIPVIVSPNPKNIKLSIRQPFGPMLDCNHLPIKPGTRFLASKVYNAYNLKQGKGFNDAWNSDVLQAGACILRLPEKNGLPVQSPIAIGMSPLGEVMRVVAGKKRLGLTFYGSGGTPVVNGFVSPSPNSQAATNVSGGRNGATFETPQTVENKANLTMDQLCERGSPIPIFVTGKVLPDEFHDKTLPKGEQSMYLGPYRITQCAQQEPLDRTAINEMISFYIRYYPELDSVMLRFHLEYRKQYLAQPLQYNERVYSYLEVDKADNRQPLFEVEDDASYPALLSTTAPQFISEKEMVTDWIHKGGYLELSDYPYEKPGSANPKMSDTSTILHPLETTPTNRRLPQIRMAHRSKRRIHFDQHWEILLKASIASFARLLELHVDTSGKIGPLIDSCALMHTGESELTNYRHYFGVEQPMPILELVGPEFQMSPTSHPIRT